MATVSSATNEIIGDISGASPLGLKGSAVDGASAVAVDMGSRNTLANASARLLKLSNCGVEKFAVDANGIPTLQSADAGAAANSATMNKPAGTFTKLGSGTQFTLTNSLITTGVHVFGMMNTHDATATAIESIVVDTSAHTAVFNFVAAPTGTPLCSFYLLKFV